MLNPYSYINEPKLDSLTDIKDLSTTTPIRKIRINNKPKFLVDKFFSEKKTRPLIIKKPSQGTNSMGNGNTGSFKTHDLDEKMMQDRRKHRHSSFKQTSVDKKFKKGAPVIISKFQPKIIEEEKSNSNKDSSKNRKVNLAPSRVMGPCTQLVKIQSKNNYNESMPGTMSDFSRTINNINKTGEICYSKSSFKPSARREKRLSIKIDGKVKVFEESLANDSDNSRKKRKRYRNCRSMSAAKKGILKKNTRSCGKSLNKKGTRVSFSRKKKVFKYNPNQRIESKATRKRKVKSEANGFKRSGFGNTSNLGDLSILGDNL